MSLTNLSGYVSCRLAPNWEQTILKAAPPIKKKLSAKLIKQTIEDGNNPTFIHALTGQAFTLADAKENKCTLNIRYDKDTKVCVVKL